MHLCSCLTQSRTMTPLPSALFAPSSSARVMTTSYLSSLCIVDPALITMLPLSLPPEASVGAHAMSGSGSFSPTMARWEERGSSP